MSPPSAAAVSRIGNAWHIPRNVEPPLGGNGTMRDPVNGIAPELLVSIFSGNQFQGLGEAGNQLETGSTVFFRKAGSAAWTALPMRFSTAGGNNKYFVAVLSITDFSVDDEVQYYLKLPYSDHLTTFLHGNDAQSFATANESEAQAAPFSFVVAAQTTNFLTLDSGPLQGRVFTISGRLQLAGPDLAGKAHANVITIEAPVVSIARKTFTLAPVVSSRNVPTGLELTYKLDAAGITALLSFPNDNTMRYEVTNWNGVVAKETSLTVFSDATEQFYGFGEKFNVLNQSGKLIRTETIDNPGTKGEQSYKAAPWFVSTRGYGFHLDSSADSRFDLRATHTDRYVVNHLFSTLRFNLVYGPNLPDVLKRFAAFTGRPFLPPPWVFGSWISSDIWRSGGEIRYAVKNFVQNFKQRGIPVSAFVFDSPWETAYNDFQFNMTQFGKGDDFEGDHYEGFTSVQQMMTFLQNNGLKVICWMAPFVNTHSDPENLPNRFQANGAPEPVPGQNLGKAANYDEGAKKGFFVKQSTGGPSLVVPWWKGKGSPVDFTNAGARDWFAGQLQKLLGQSSVVTRSGASEPAIGGFKTDDGETRNTDNPPKVYIPLTAIYADGRTGAEMRNAYCFEYQKCVSGVLGSNGILFARSGFVGCPAFPGHWPGDNEPNFGANGLPSVMVAGLSAAMSGYSIWGHDVGGYQNSNFGASSADRADLFMRWTQFACFSPIMQMHRQVHPQLRQDLQSGKAEELRQYPWGYGDAALKNYQFFARLHTRLFPYIFTYAKESTANGLPILRPLVLLNQTDTNTFGVEHAYHFGNEFLVAPIVTLNSSTRQVYLPAGNWFDFWSNTRHTGKQTITWQNTNRSQFPLFVREGGIIPLLLEDVQTLCDANYVNNAGISSPGGGLQFLIYPANQHSEFTVYDGTSIACDPAGTGLSLTLSSNARPIILQVFSKEPAQVTRNGNGLQKQTTPAGFDVAESGWRFDSATAFVFIKFSHQGGLTRIQF
jgi:alpha-D-xyloside xylohydrolase